MTVDPQEIARRRAVLQSVRMRFSSETQSLRNETIDRITEQNMLLIGAGAGVTAQSFQQLGALDLPGGVPLIGTLDLTRSLQRLEAAGRVRLNDSGSYELSPDAAAELWDAQARSEQRFSRVLAALLRNRGASLTQYSEPFLDALAFIFGALGEFYALVIKGERASAEVADQPHFADAVSRAATRHPGINRELLNELLVEFFQGQDPDHEQIKWNMAQNYFLAKIIGMDPAGALLSRDVFEDASFILDTNIIIPALEPDAPHHSSFKSLVAACRHLGAQLRVYQITLDELRGVVRGQRDMVPRVVDQIPPKTLPRLRAEHLSRKVPFGSRR